MRAPTTVTAVVRLVPVIVSVTCPVGAAPVPEPGATVITAGAPSTVALVTVIVVVEVASAAPTPVTFIPTGASAASLWSRMLPLRVP